MKRFASLLALASALAVTALSPAAAAHHRPHFVFARIGAGVCDGLVCTGSFFATLPAACGLVMVPSTTRFVIPLPDHFEWATASSPLSRHRSPGSDSIQADLGSVLTYGITHALAPIGR